MESKATSSLDVNSPAPERANSTASEIESSIKRKRQPRNSACRVCAALKMKCVPTATGRCERYCKVLPAKDVTRIFDVSDLILYVLLRRHVRHKT
jgi:hypothetical protein